MLKTWNEYSNAHFANRECPKRIVKTLWALAVCAGFGALCGVVCGAAIGLTLGTLLGGGLGFQIGFVVGAGLGAIAGFFAGLIGATIGGVNGWLIGGFFGGAFIGLWLFFFTGILGAGAATFVADEILRQSQRNKLCRWISNIYNNSDLGEWHTRKLWIAPVFAFYFLSLYSAFRLLSTY